MLNYSGKVISRATLLVLIFSLLALPVSSREVCKEVLTEMPPFLVTDADSGQGKKEWDNFKGIDSTLANVGKLNNVAVIPRYSIVKPLVNHHVLETIEKREYLPVQVISTPTIEMAQELEKSTFAGRPGKPFVQPGDVGFIYGGLIKHAMVNSGLSKDDRAYTDQEAWFRKDRENSSIIVPGLAAQYTPGKKDVVFVVKKDIFSFRNKSGQIDRLKDKVLKLATKDGKYRAIRCHRGGDEDDFTLEHLFEIYAADGEEKLGETRMDADCALLSELHPVSSDNYDQIRNIAGAIKKDSGKEVNIPDIKYWAAKDMIQMPGEPILLDGGDAQYLYLKGPFGTIHYAGQKFPINRGSKLTSDHWKVKRALKEVASDRWMKSKAACSFYSALKKFREKYPNAPDVQVGDSYWPVGERHGGHSKGNCVDVRPFRQDGYIAPLNTQFNNKASELDKEMTAHLIKEFQAAGAANMICDRMSHMSGVRKDGGHGGHMHLCFDEKQYPKTRGKLKTSCNFL